MRLLWTVFSRIFDAIGNPDIGRWFSGLVESPDLKTGTIFSIFQTEGTADGLIDKLIMYARGHNQHNPYVDQAEVRQYRELSSFLDTWVLLVRIF